MRRFRILRKMPPTAARVVHLYSVYVVVPERKHVLQQTRNSSWTQWGGGRGDSEQMS